MWPGGGRSDPIISSVSFRQKYNDTQLMLQARTELTSLEYVTEYLFNGDNFTSSVEEDLLYHLRVHRTE